MKTTLVIGGNFAGMTAALEIKRKAKDKQRVIVIDRSKHFLFIPSLIWVPFGRREIEDISFEKKSVLEKRGVEFIQTEATSVDPDKNIVYTKDGEYTYDDLVVCTGPKVDYDCVPGLRQHCCYIGHPDGAMNTRATLEEFKKNPGPIVIGSTQNAGCMGAAYEFLFNLEKWLREQNIRKKVDLYWVTPEDYLGHFGIDGMPLGESMLKAFMKMFKIHYRTQVGIKEVTEGSVILSTGEEIKSKFTMLMPEFKGVDFVMNSPKLEATKSGYMVVGHDYRHKKYPNVWAAGTAVDVPPPFTPEVVPFNIPKTGYPADVTGKVVAKNIIRLMNGKTKLKEKPWGKIAGICIMDAGKKEVIILSNNLFRPRVFAVMIPNILYDFGKVLFEKYFIWKSRRGYSWLP